MYIDTHCHLNFQSFEKDLSTVINRAKQQGIQKIVIPGAKMDSSEKAVKISLEHNNCFAAVGIHPHHALEATERKFRDVLTKIELLSTSPKVVAIGEIGMDYHHYKNSPPPDEHIKTVQKKIFIAQLEIAYRKKLPIIIHCRWAQSDVYEIISEFIKSSPLEGVFHCFDGNLDFLKKVISLGFYVGFDGNSTYPENNHLRKLIQATPLDRLVIETDSPFLTPEIHRKERNEPAYLVEIAKIIARSHSISLSKVEEVTTKNATSLFRI